MRTDLTNSEIMRDEAVAELVDVPVRTLSQWRYLGKGPAYIKVGRHVRYRRSDVEAWLDAQTRTAGGS